jgi:uncharacterized protein
MTHRTKLLQDNLITLYEPYKASLLFHGWHHIAFVARKSVEFAAELHADPELVEAAALVHDLNYLVDVKSRVDAGKALRTEQLQKAGFNNDEIATIEDAVHSASTDFRHADISNIAKAVADADSLFKVMPVAPILLTPHFISETKTDLKKWSERIIRDQQPLLEQGIYFYTETAKQRYLGWAELNLKLVSTIRESLDDPDMQDFLEACKTVGLL